MKLHCKRKKKVLIYILFNAICMVNHKFPLKKGVLERSSTEPKRIRDMYDVVM